jgi:hypothetical protein
MEELLKRVKHDLSKAEARLDQYEKGTLEYEFNVLQLYAVVCRLCAVGKLRIGAVTCWCGLLPQNLNWNANAFSFLF